MTSAENEREPCSDSHCGDVSAMTCAAYNDTSVQPQTHAMGAARSERGGGETAYDRTDRYGSEMFPVPGVRAVNMAWQKTELTFTTSGQNDHTWSAAKGTKVLFRFGFLNLLCFADYCKYNIAKGQYLMDKTLTYKMVFDSYPDVVTINQMREMLGGIGVKTAYNLLRSAEIESFCIGRAYRIPKINILKYLNLL